MHIGCGVRDDSEGVAKKERKLMLSEGKGKAMNFSQALCLPPSRFSMAAIWWSNLSPATGVCNDDRRGVERK